MNINKESYDSIIFVDESTRIAFTAGVSSSSTTWNSGTLVFPNVITNVGNGYNPSDGVFTAPRAGLYVFFVNIQSYTNEDYVYILLNGSKKVQAHAETDNSGSYQAGPNVSVLNLQTGDRVWVAYGAGTGYTGNMATTFSGFKI